jgi:hypothetical protein
LDASFVTDLFEIVADFRRGYSELAPMLGVTRLGLEWLEVSGLHAYLTYQAASNRPTIAGELAPSVQRIPSLARGHFHTQAMLVKAASNRNPFADLVDALKLDIFHQAVEEYGSSAWYMNYRVRFATTLEVPVSHAMKTIDDIGSRVTQEQLAEIARHIREFGLLPSLIMGKIGGGESEVSVMDLGQDARIYAFKQQKKVEFPVAGGKKRVRPPQAFTDNRIGGYNEKIAIAQLIVQNSGLAMERIRMGVQCEITNDYVFVTDHYVMVLPLRLDRVGIMIQLATISGLEVVVKDVRIQGKRSQDKLGFRCPDECIANRFRTFIASQRYQCIVLGKSILR